MISAAQFDTPLLLSKTVISWISPIFQHVNRSDTSPEKIFGICTCGRANPSYCPTHPAYISSDNVSYNARSAICEL